MSDQKVIKSQQELLATYRTTLHHLLLQQAALGIGHVPPHIAHSIIDARKNIASIKAKLQGWGVHIEDHPEDDDILLGITLNTARDNIIFREVHGDIGKIILETMRSRKICLSDMSEVVDYISIQDIIGWFNGSGRKNLISIPILSCRCGSMNLVDSSDVKYGSKGYWITLGLFYPFDEDWEVCGFSRFQFNKVLCCSDTDVAIRQLEEGKLYACKLD